MCSVNEHQIVSRAQIQGGQGAMLLSISIVNLVQANANPFPSRVIILSVPMSAWGDNSNSPRERKGVLTALTKNH